MCEKNNIIRNNKSVRPLVTFAIIAYNQEKYVREAVEAAFAQTYDPMEIILSDDCSSDRTIEVMKSIAKKYRGKKRVVVRQTKINCGTLLHVTQVARLAQGQLLVLAAGDDISKPQRTTTLVEAWQSSGAWGLCSKFDNINEFGLLRNVNQTASFLTSPDYPLRRYFSNNQSEVNIIHGATSAYDIRLFDYLDTQPEDYVLSEDGVMSVLINLLNKKVKILSESLVYYREHEDSLTNAKMGSGQITFQRTVKDELAISRFARSQANRCQLFIRLQDKLGKNSEFPLAVNYLHNEFERQRIRALWRETSFNKRVQHILKNPSLTELKWCLPRMLPEPIFIAIKTLLKKFSILAL